jgi:predicted transposase/invertase (TIGR01784 family)
LKQEKLEWKRVAILKVILYYLDSARKDADQFLDVEFYREVEEEFMTILEKIKEEGIEKGKLEDARLMKEYGDPIEKIMKITGLSEIQLKENGIL